MHACSLKELDEEAATEQRPSACNTPTFQQSASTGPTDQQHDGQKHTLL
jgi:hypothetical protein